MRNWLLSYPALWLLAPLLLTLLVTGALIAISAGAGGADFIAARERMVMEQLARRDITNQRILKVMGHIPRHELVPLPLRDEAYDDHPLPIGHDQTISQPYIVAFMTQVLDPQTNDVVLEVGTGSGYQAAVLAALVKKVHTIDIVEPLARRAALDLQRLAITNVQVRAGDGYQGWPDAAPFDGIIVTCAPDHIPPRLVEQLKEGGRMIIPVGPPHDQSLYLLQKVAGLVQRQAVLPVRFVPMTGQARQAAP